MEVFSADGNLITDNERLLHRVWHQAVYTTDGDKYYDQPLDHEPTVLALGLNEDYFFGMYPMRWQHIVQNGQWVGLTLTATTSPPNETLIVVFARR